MSNCKWGKSVNQITVQHETIGLVKVLPPADVMHTIATVKEEVTTTILDPWYNKGVGGVRDDYEDWLNHVVAEAAKISQHVFVLGFPEIVYRVLDSIPERYELVAWLTWYYKNCTSVIRGWRSAQLACLHLGRKGAPIYPEHFLNGAQSQRLREGKLRYMPGPPSVIEAHLNIGFVGRNEQTGHPAQKPVKTIEPLVMMTTQEGDLVLDPMCGAGTTGVVCQQLRRRCILCDISPQWVEVTKKRLKGEHISATTQKALFNDNETS